MIHWLSQWLTAITNSLTEALLYVSRTLFEWYFGVKPTVDATNGAYVYDVLQVQIDASCAGISFFGYTLLLFAVLGYQRSGVSGLVASPLFAFSLAAMGNSVRLIASVYIQEIGDIFLPPGPHYRLHEWLGYLIFGGIWLILVLWATKRKKEHGFAPGGEAAAPVQDGRVEKRQAKRPKKLCRTHFSTDQTNGTTAEHPLRRPNNYS